ncbi:MAG: MFS transporter [Bowdeniella nasicola]|nr:MFS transporter [Bowdeniella nasicola]
MHTSRPTTSAPTPLTGRARWLALGSIALAVALVIMDATIANVALPVVIRELSLTPSAAQWVNAVYSLVFAAFIITAGRAGDLFGRRTLASGGLIVFLLASLAAGASTSAAWLIAARTVQGLGAACVMPATLSTINALFRGRDRSIAFAVYGSMIGGMAAVGPLVGGWLATDVSWRWAFWLNIPFGLIALAGLIYYTPNTRGERVQPGLRSFDILGVVLASVALGAIVFALIESSTYGWWRRPSGALSPILPTLALGLVALAGFLAWERHRERQGADVLVHLGLFRVRTFTLGVATAFLVSLGEFGLIFVLPLLLQGALGYDPLATGWLMMALAAGTFLASGLVPHLVRAWGKRTVIRVGLIAEALAVAVLAVATPLGSGASALVLAAYGMGIGLANAQLTDTTMEDVPVSASGEASGLQTTIRQLGSALGIALLGGLMIGQLATHTEAALRAADYPEPAVEQITDIVHDSVGAAIPALDQHDPAAADLARTALIDASRTTFGLGAGVLGLGVVMSLALPATRPRTTEDDEPAAPMEASADNADPRDLQALR